MESCNIACGCVWLLPHLAIEGRSLRFEEVCIFCIPTWPCLVGSSFPRSPSVSPEQNQTWADAKSTLSIIVPCNSNHLKYICCDYYQIYRWVRHNYRSDSLNKCWISSVYEYSLLILCQAQVKPIGNLISYVASQSVDSAASQCLILIRGPQTWKN